MLEEIVLKTIENNNLIEKQDNIVVAVSGGPDSMCLLDFLYCLKQKKEFEITVAHINHMIRVEADEETEYVKKYCDDRKIPFFVKKIDVVSLAKENKIGTEEMGRLIRYKFFNEVAQKINANKIAIAHNLNDNAETVLLNLLRGSGIRGLKGIEVKRKEKEIEYIQPLREASRNQIEEYCEKRKLNPKIDKSNFENIYNRNKIRNILIPMIEKEFNSNIVQTLNRLSEIAKDEDDYFSQIIEQEYEKIKIGENENEVILDLNRFNLLSKVIKSRIILYTINRVKGSVAGISKIHIDDIINLCKNNIGNKYLKPKKDLKIYLKKGKIFFMTKTNLP